MDEEKESPSRPSAQADDRPDARTIARNRLDVREYSAAEMRAYLKRKGYPEAEAKQAVTELVSEQLLSDQRYARVVTRAQANRGKGPHYVRAKLQSKGVRVDAKQATALYDDCSSQPQLEAARQV